MEISDLLLHLHIDLPLRYQIFSCSWGADFCWLAHQLDATLSDLLLHLHTELMLHYLICCCVCTPMRCYVTRCSLAVGVGWGGVGRTSEENDILVPLRYQIFPCTCTPICELMLRWQIFSCCDIGRQICEKKIRDSQCQKKCRNLCLNYNSSKNLVISRRRCNVLTYFRKREQHIETHETLKGFTFS